jgi:hypothetical protein
MLQGANAPYFFAALAVSVVCGGLLVALRQQHQQLQALRAERQRVAQAQAGGGGGGGGGGEAGAAGAVRHNNPLWAGGKGSRGKRAALARAANPAVGRRLGAGGGSQ